MSRSPIEPPSFELPPVRPIEVWYRRSPLQIALLLALGLVLVCSTVSFLAHRAGIEVGAHAQPQPSTANSGGTQSSPSTSNEPAHP